MQEVMERSGIVSAASAGDVEAMLETLDYALFNEDVQVTEREVVSVVEITPADVGADVAEDSFKLETRDGSLRGGD